MQNLEDLELIRVCLMEDGTVQYVPKYKNDEDYANTMMQPLDALHAITARRVPMELATTDPWNYAPHSYELLLKNPDGSTTESVVLNPSGVSQQ